MSASLYLGSPMLGSYQTKFRNSYRKIAYDIFLPRPFQFINNLLSLAAVEPIQLYVFFKKRKGKLHLRPGHDGSEGK